MRNGQWVLFRVVPSTPVLLDECHPFQPVGDSMEAVLSQVHRAQDGRYVGLYYGQGPLGNSRQISPDRVIPVLHNTGLNVRVDADSSASGKLISYAVRDVTELEAAHSRDDLPQDRIASRLASDPNWQPRGFRE